MPDDIPVARETASYILQMRVNPDKFVFAIHFDAICKIESPYKYSYQNAVCLIKQSSFGSRMKLIF